MADDVKVNCPNCGTAAVVGADGKCRCPTCDGEFVVEGGEPRLVGIGAYQKLLADNQELAAGNAKLAADVKGLQQQLAEVRKAIAEGSDNHGRAEPEEPEEDDDEDDGVWD
jgi:uncharacterized Zn finger protein (UPF0148 family)